MVSVPLLVVIGLGCLAAGIYAGMLAGKRTSPRSASAMPSNGSPRDFNREQAAAVDDAITKLAGDFPVPGYDLIYLVSPAFDTAQFLRSGAEHLGTLTKLLTGNGVQLESLRTVLDFGCGCGRVLRHFPKLGLKGLKLYGSDYNADLIDWCRRNLSFAEFAVNKLEPPLPYPDRTFDFVYAISVFTHLTEPLQFAWLDEMARIVRPGGCLAITVHGSAFLIDLDEAQQQRFRSGQLVVKNPDNAGKNSCGTYHPVQYIKEKFTHAFDILEIAEQTNLRWQDFYLFRRRK
jgi:SAM-dependent methyltransferase